MNIGATIKKIRRQREMTQERLAEYLNISVSAVSQWESEKTMPDISVIPAICNLLGVTSDELLGIDISQKKANIKKLIDEISEISRVGLNKEAYERYRKALKEYPDSYDLMHKVASTYIWLEHDSSYTQEEHKNMREESILLLEKILEGCLDEDIRLFALSDLCGFYARDGRLERAKELALKMPRMFNSSDFLLAGIHGGTKGVQYNQSLVFDFLQFLVNRIERNYRLDNGEMLYSEEEINRLHDKQINLLQFMFEDGDYGFYYDDLQNAYSKMARYFAKHGDREEAISNLQLAADSAIGFLKYLKRNNYVHTSLIFKGYDVSSRSVWFSDNNNSASTLLNLMQAPEFNIIREDKKFSEIEIRLKEYTGKWNTI